MLIPLFAGICAFVLFVLFDLCKAQPQTRFCGLLFAGGMLLLAGATGVLLFPLSAPLTPLRIIGLLWACFWLILLVYVLFFALPASDVYVEGASLSVCDRGAYALCRHPGGWCLLFGYLGLWLFAWSDRMGIGAVTFSVLNFIYIALQDRWLFPRYITGYSEYRQQVPFLFPSRRSIARCFSKGKSN